MPRIAARFRKFFLTPASPLPLAILRIGLSLILLIQAFSISRIFLELYGSESFIQPVVQQYLDNVTENHTTLDTFLNPLRAHFGITDAVWHRTLFVIYLGFLATLLFGWKTRWSAVMVWLTHYLLFFQNNFSSYGVDQFAHISLFFFIWMPVGDAFSLDSISEGAFGKPSSWAGLSLRYLQIYLCIVYLSTAVEKAVGAQWWSGEAIWRSLMLPEFQQMDMGWLAGVPWMAKLIGWSTLLVEGGYALFVWPTSTRRVWLVLTVALHLGIAIWLGLILFSLTMILLTVCAFGLAQQSSVRRQANGPLINLPSFLTT